MTNKNKIPTSIKIIYSTFMLILIPVYWKEYGWENFLWFSDVTLFMTFIALWLESGLLISAGSIWFLPFAFAWNVCFFSSLVFGHSFGITDYMFDTSIPLFIRGLSLFHMWLPILLIWMLYRLKYNAKAPLLISVVTWGLLPITYLLTDPQSNINWVFGPMGTGQNLIDPLLYLFLIMAIIPIVVYLPMHFLLKALTKK